MQSKRNIVNKEPLRFTVSAPDELMQFLIANNPKKSRDNIKSWLKDRCVTVNGIPFSQYNHPLLPNDAVMVHWTKQKKVTGISGLEIIYEDEFLIVINKKAGLLTIGTDKVRTNTAYHILSDYVKRSHSQNKIFVVHRLDRETSGLMLFAKTERIQELLQQDWNETILERTYIAVLEGVPRQSNGRIQSYLAENKAMVVYSTKDTANGQLAVTHFEVMQSKSRYSLVKFNLETGRKNQIRVHAHDMGHSIAGDAKYGAQSNPLKRLALHAWVLAFYHPMLKENMKFETDIPKEFVAITTPKITASQKS